MLRLYGKSVSIKKTIESKLKEATIKGWIYRKRSSGGKAFVIIHDTTGTVQCIVDKSVVKEQEWNDIDKAYLESSVMLRGTLREDSRAPGGVEMDVKELKVIHSGEQFPITEYQSAEFLLDKRHLWLRSQKMTAVMRARAYIFRYAREFLDKRGFYEVTPPTLTSSGGETGANLFEVNYFGEKMYLTESSQLYAEALVPALGNVYSCVPSYRAEKSRTVKHLAEYWHLEPEMAYYNLSMDMKLQEKMVSNIANNVAKKNEDILKLLGVDSNTLLKVKPPFKRITYEKAIEILNDKKAHKKWGDDFGVEDEMLLTEDEDKPIFVMYLPKEIKPFYMPINPKDERTVMGADVLAPKGHGEIIGGSERIWIYEELIERMKETEKAQNVTLNMKNYEWWLDIRKYGSVPHAGFGMGMERLIKWILNLDHIRDAIPFPRMVNRMYP